MKGKVGREGEREEERGKREYKREKEGRRENLAGASRTRSASIPLQGQQIWQESVAAQKHIASHKANAKCTD